MKQENLEELIEKSRNGDRQSQEKLVLAVQDKVYYHCRKMLKSPEDAMDAAQDILVAMLGSLEKLREPAAFWAWLNRMTSNVCCKRLTQSRREAAFWGEDPAAPLSAPGEDLDDQLVPERVLDNEENRRMVVELVEALPEAQRLSVLFYYYDEMSVKEIAEAMETSENTVKSRLRYARESIRQGVERYAGQGFKLYGLTPVPFLRYFLQKEAAETVGLAAGRAALGAAAVAAASSAGGGTVVTAALSKALGGMLAHKGLVALAGLTLAGAVTGGVLLHRSPAAPAEEPQPEPETLTETVPYTPPESEPPTLAPEFTPEAPAAPAKPLVTAPAWMGEGPAPETEEPSPQETEAVPEEAEPPEVPAELDVPEDGEAEDLEAQTPQPDPRPEASREPDRDGDEDDDRDRDSDPEPRPEPDPEPDPKPESPVVPVPPAVSVQYEPNPNFGDYLGQTDSGVHEFLYSARLPDKNSGQYPFKQGQYYTQVQIENPLVVRTNGPYIYGVGEGETDVRYYVSEKEAGPYELKALVHVQVLRQPIEAGEGYREVGMPDPAENGALLLERTFYADGTDQPQPLVFKGLEMKLESGDPAVLGVRPETNRFYGIAPGTAEGRVYLRIGDGFPWELRARVNFTVEPLPTPPENTEVCRPREDFSPENGAEGAREAAYQGLDSQGLYAFDVTVQEGDVFRLQPFEEGACVVDWSIGNSDVLAFENLTEETFRAGEWGDTTVTYTVRPEGEEDFIPCAVVYVHVLPAHPPYYPNPDFGECLGRDEQDVWRFKAELTTDGPGLPSALASGNYFLRTVSGDPGIAAVRDGKLYGVAPGSTEVRYYVSKTEDTGYFLQAVALVEVKAPEPEEPEKPEESLIPPGAQVVNLDAGDFGRCQGYGYRSKFIYDWEFLSKDPLPSVLEYRSSNPKVIVINEEGAFTTLSAGKAVLAAWDPGDPSVCYTLTFQVEDRFDWSIFGMLVLDTYAGKESDAFVDGYSIDYEVKLLGIEWSCEDTELLTVSPVKDMMLRCHLSGHAPGTATVTGKARFSLVTAADQLVEMTDTISFQVNVLP